jgi:hypothetical protein
MLTQSSRRLSGLGTARRLQPITYHRSLIRFSPAELAVGAAWGEHAVLDWVSVLLSVLEWA